MKYESLREWWSINKPTPFRIRCWLIKTIAGRMCVLINFEARGPLTIPKGCASAFVYGCDIRPPSGEGDGRG